MCPRPSRSSRCRAMPAASAPTTPRRNPLLLPPRRSRFRLWWSPRRPARSNRPQLRSWCNPPNLWRKNPRPPQRRLRSPPRRPARSKNPNSISCLRRNSSRRISAGIVPVSPAAIVRFLNAMTDVKAVGALTGPVAKEANAASRGIAGTVAVASKAISARPVITDRRNPLPRRLRRPRPSRSRRNPVACLAG